MSWKEERELEGLEPKIFEAEERVAEIDAMFADPNFYRDHGSDAQALNDEKEALQGSLEVLYARWEELEQIREASA